MTPFLVSFSVLLSRAICFLRPGNHSLKHIQLNQRIVIVITIACILTEMSFSDFSIFSLLLSNLFPRLEPGQ
uniref:Putative secreted protein n=1 Tax=Anopheles triannulatus TaxID=58253 RepID=A0A2M4B5X1_9DIPT